uniref:Uncharacterized protein MANES_13G152400 n=1 Tax=Rhizophora mucronata TaxID=61149 RepID=A0A2P2JSA4_RHIMU
MNIIHLSSSNIHHYYSQKNIPGASYFSLTFFFWCVFLFFNSCFNFSPARHHFLKFMLLDKVHVRVSHSPVELVSSRKEIRRNVESLSGKQKLETKELAVSRG